MSTAEPAIAAQSTSEPAVPVNPKKKKKPRHPPEKVALILAQMKAVDGSPPPMIRALARQHNLPESTLRSWRAREARESAPGLATVVFFESADGIYFLHRLVTALGLVFGLQGSCGPSLQRLFLHLTGLDSWVACSDTTLRAQMRRLTDAVGDWGEQAQQELAQTMPWRKISLGLDETFFAQMILVAMDTVSGYIFLEQASGRRDAATWERCIRESLTGLKVELIQLVGDGATALRKLAKDLGIVKIEDLWHGQNTITRGTSGPLAARVRQAEATLAAAHAAREQEARTRAAYEQGPRHPGRPPSWVVREIRIAQAIEAAEAAQKQTQDWQESMGQAVRDLGLLLHPVDLATGALQDAAQVDTGLQEIFARMTRIAHQARLGESSHAALRKAARLIPSWVASVAHWHARLEQQLAELAQPEAVVAWVRNVIIPLVYLDRSIGQARDADRREALRTVRVPLAEMLAEPAGPWCTLPLPLRHALLAFARDAVDLFQRSTGCVEGRNGYLSLHQHHRRGLGAALIKALTVVHNFVLTRADGTTAAVRLFGRAPEQPLFDHLCQVLPPPAIPRKRSRRPAVDVFCEAA